MAINSAETELYRLYTSLNDICRTYGIDLPVPRLAVIGVQSAGKTSLLETFAGFPLGYTSPDTGTRCPVEYTFSHDPSLESPLIELNGAVVTEQELLTKLSDIMKDLERMVKFSEDVVRVKVSSKYVTNIVLVDLPGLIPSANNADRYKAEQVKRIVQKIARDPNYSLIAVLKCTESPETLADFEILDSALTENLSDSSIPPPRTKWKSETLVIVNYINQYLSERSVFPNPTKAKIWLESHQKDGPRYFVILKPNPDFVREDSSSDAIRDFLQSQSVLERQMFDDWKARISNGSFDHWDTNLDKYLTLANAQKAIEHLFVQRFKEMLPHISNTVDKLLESDKETLAKELQQLDKLDPKKYAARCRKYSEDFAEHLAALITSTMLRTSTGVDVTNYNIPDTYIFQPSRYGNTWEEELKTHSDISKWKFLIPSSELLSAEHLQNHQLGMELDLKLVGVAFIRRAIKMTSYFIYNVPMEESSKHDIFNIGGYNPNKADTFPTDSVVSSLARAQLQKVKEAFNFLRAHILGTATSYATIARNFLFSDVYKDFASDEIMLALCREMSNEYISMLDEQLRKVYSRVSQSVDMYGDYLRTDLPVLSLMMAITNPMEKRLLSEEALVPELPKQPTGKHSIGDVTIPAGKKLIRYHREEMEPDQHASEVRRMLLKYNEFIADNVDKVSLADLVAGGFSTFLPVDSATVYEHIPYIKACAHELFVHYVFWIMLDGEMAMNKYVTEYLPNDGKSQLKLKFQDHIADLTTDSIAQVMGTNKTEIDKHILDLQTKITSLNLAKTELERWKFR